MHEDAAHEDPFDPSRREFLERGAAFGLGLATLNARSAGAFAPTERIPADPMAAVYTSHGDEFTLGNGAIAGAWSTAGGTLRVVRFSDKVNHAALAPAASPFSLELADGSRLDGGAMHIAAGPRAERLIARPSAPRLAERSAGWEVTVVLRDPDARLEVTWRAVLRDGSRYLRQEVALSALRGPLAVNRIVLVDVALPGAAVVGAVRGSPVVGGGVYTAFEHPLSESTVAEGRVRCSLGRELPLRPGALLTVSSVTGTARTGQMRRDFLEYVERERAHPYRTFLHYNSWYDIGYFSKYSESDALAVVTAFGNELRMQRDVIAEFLPIRRWLG